jgi:trk system potassium uptake protein
MKTKQFVIIGIGAFGKRMLDELSELDVDIMIVDKDKNVIDQNKGLARAAYITDVINQDTLRKIIPESVDAAIIDLGDTSEVSILVTNYLAQQGVKRIIVKASNDQHGAILKIVGATDVIFPDREASRRMAPLLASTTLLNYLPIGDNLVIAESTVPKKYSGMPLVDSNIRRDFDINVIAYRKGEDSNYTFTTPAYRMDENDVLLLAGSEEAVTRFSGKMTVVRKKGKAGLFKRLFRGKR